MVADAVPSAAPRGRRGRRRSLPLSRLLALLIPALLMPLPLMPARAADSLADSPAEWLKRMSQAVEYLNYEGTLIHLHDDQSVELTIVHRVDNGRITERITSADGGREIIRTDNEVTCILPDQRTVLIEARDGADSERSPMRGHLPGPAGIDPLLYHVAFGERAHVAGRAVQGIAIRPRDGFRYGYRLWLDHGTAMPLKTQLLNDDGQILEQVLFTQVNLPERLPDSAVRPSIVTDGFTVRRRGPETPTVAREIAAEWTAAELPPGFMLTLRQAKTPADAPDRLRHLVYSDGLATVSLFVEPAGNDAGQAAGLSQVGAANAYTAIVDGHMVTAIGDVPVRTVELLARSARRTPAAPPAAR